MGDVLTMLQQHTVSILNFQENATDVVANKNFCWLEEVILSIIMPMYIFLLTYTSHNMSCVIIIVNINKRKLN